MITDANGPDLSTTLFGKTRCAILALLFTHADEGFYLRQIVRTTGAGLGATQRELKTLAGAGMIQRDQRGQQVYYRANARCPVFRELKNLVAKTIGGGELLRAALAPLSDRIEVAFLYGSFAEQRERRGSDIDLFIVGRVSFSDVLAALEGAETRLDREINPTVYPVEEFRTKLQSGHHFLTSVLKEKRIFILGNEHGLERLAPKLLGNRAPKQRSRNPGSARARRPRPA